MSILSIFISEHSNNSNSAAAMNQEQGPLFLAGWEGNRIFENQETGKPTIYGQDGVTIAKWVHCLK